MQADVTEDVDRLLRGHTISPERRMADEDGIIRKSRGVSSISLATQNGRSSHRAESPVEEHEEEEELDVPVTLTRILPYGVNKGKLLQAVQGLDAPVEVVAEMARADLLLTTKNYYRRRTQALKMAEQQGKPVYVLRKNTLVQIQQFVQAIARKQNDVSRSENSVVHATQEAEEAAVKFEDGATQVDLSPQGAYIRHLQYKIADKYGLASSSAGREPSRHVVIYRR